MIQFKQAHIGYSNDLIREINLELPASGIIGLFGKNGTGKSTLFKTLIGLQSLRKGTITLENESLKDIHPKALAKKIAYCPTQLFSYGNMTVMDVVSNGRIPHLSWLGKLGKKDKDIVSRSMEIMDIGNIKDQLISECSDGQKQKAMIASALAQETSVILLDEPTAFLDYPSKLELIKQLETIANSGKLILISSHDLDLFDSACNLKLLIHEQKIVSSKDSEFGSLWADFTS